MSLIGSCAWVPLGMIRRCHSEAGKELALLHGVGNGGCLLCARWGLHFSVTECPLFDAGVSGAQEVVP